MDTRNEQLRMFHHDDQGRALKYFSGVNRQLKESQEQLVFAMNAGMYRGARIVESSRYLQLNEHVQIATQSGPLLVLDGALHPAFREDSTSRNIRNGVGTLSRHEVVFAISEQPVTFHEFARLFRNGLGCKDALFLDATVSSLYSKNLDRADVRASLGPIIGVTEKLPNDE